MSSHPSMITVVGCIAGVPRLSAVDGTLLVRFNLINNDTGDDTVESVIVQLWDEMAQNFLHIRTGDIVSCEGERLLDHIHIFSKQVRATKLKVA